MMMKRLFVKNLIINNFFELVQSGLPFPEARSIYETTPELLVVMSLYDGHAFLIFAVKPSAGLIKER